MGGWIKLYRELLDKPIWLESTPEQKVILITLLSMANHKEKEWEWKGVPYKAEPGQFVTSLPSIVKKSGKGVSLQNVRTALKRFEKYGFLTDESTKQNRLITIVNWGLYQADDEESNRQTNSQLTDDQQTANSHLTANKNDKEYKNDKNERNKPTSSHKKRVYDSDSIYYLLAEKLFKQICQNQEIKRPNLNAWADDIRKMIEIDKRTEDQVRRMIIWSQSNSFWAPIIMSAKKFRDKYDTMAAQANREAKQPNYGKRRVESMPKHMTDKTIAQEKAKISPALQKELEEKLKFFEEDNHDADQKTEKRAANPNGMDYGPARLGAG